MLSTLSHVISQKVAEVFDLYTALHGARVSFFGPDREILYPDAGCRPNCAYCRLLREDLGLDLRCREQDRTEMSVALQRREMVAYTCHGGMREAVSPLFVDGQLAGFVMLGQFRSAAAAAESPYAVRWEAEFGERRLQEAFERSTVFPEEKVETLLAMFRQLLELIIRSQLISRRDYDRIGPVIARMRLYPEKPLTLPDAARMSRMSPSTVTRLFKKLTGRSFKQFQQSVRLQRAAELLAGSPGMPVTEVASASGFDDPLYFSRAFRRQEGVSPSGFRRRQAGTDSAAGEVSRSPA